MRKIPIPSVSPQPLCPAGQAVCRRDRDRERDRDHREADTEGVQDVRQEVRVEQEEPQVVQRRGFVEQERVGDRVEQVVVPLERRDDHPVEREGPEQREASHEGVQASAAHRFPCVHHTTSLFRTIRSIRMAMPERTGNRKREMAAPWARSPPSIPLKKVHVESTWVLCTGPPRVMT